MSDIHFLPISLRDSKYDSQEYVPIQENREVMPNQYPGGHYAIYRNKKNGKFSILLFAQERTDIEVASAYNYASSNNTEVFAGEAGIL